MSKTFLDEIKTELKNMNEGQRESILEIIKEYNRACAKHPKWPLDIIHQSAIVSEEAGELVKAALQFHYEEVSIFDVYMEAVQTGAMSLRLLVNLKGRL